MYQHLGKRAQETPPVTLSSLREMRATSEPISCITAYDASFAALVDLAGVDVVLVGDSLGMVIQGHNTTVPVTMDAMVYHSAAVARGLWRPFLITDMPFMSYATRDQALRNAARLMQEGGAKMVKLEGGVNQLNVVRALAANDIPICAHIGLTPQSVHKIGGFKVQGRDAAAAQGMIDDARALEDAGADIVLLECIPNELGKAISETLEVPVIGIGAGPDVDGQILVLYDILDITLGRTPRFVRNFMEGAKDCSDAVHRYVAAVKDRSYPAPEHCFG
ncbi:MAG: 3-methyl-2-oxobutanoate hydroxymethyltransferase [Gammaproteobacteria bacterium]|nr:3-methyl-2-oxobutanoate hydroxymethyltransferase [Gammaproteobacteria bacterium]NNF60286.1 3-methyl-2-oxobutanoate hydroxymethyltransferase [Gammaproteobacteria bacterium]NNM20394.1 3-methyl-2-oxobutanoate hydroxymethyltransferase [Gammaproteobacteria bacterium]